MHRQKRTLSLSACGRYRNGRKEEQPETQVRQIDETSGSGGNNTTRQLSGIGHDSFLKYILCLSLLNTMTLNEAPRDAPEITFWLPGRIVLVDVLQNHVRPFLHEDHCGVLLLFRCLAQCGRMFGLHDLPPATLAEPCLRMGKVPSLTLLTGLFCNTIRLRPTRCGRTMIPSQMIFTSFSKFQ